MLNVCLDWSCDSVALERGPAHSSTYQTWILLQLHQALDMSLKVVQRARHILGRVLSLPQVLMWLFLLRRGTGPCRFWGHWLLLHLKILLLLFVSCSSAVDEVCHYAEVVLWRLNILWRFIILGEGLGSYSPFEALWFTITKRIWKLSIGVSSAILVIFTKDCVAFDDETVQNLQTRQASKQEVYLFLLVQVYM